MIFHDIGFYRIYRIRDILVFLLPLLSSFSPNLLCHDENYFLALEKYGIIIMRLIVCVISMLVFRASAISEYEPST